VFVQLTCDLLVIAKFLVVRIDSILDAIRDDYVSISLVLFGKKLKCPPAVTF